ncbi:fibronectin type III domain-containing protein [Micromonospora sp. NPDC049051]|uniref:fibronectin type III domain-containing protein n=1 Tax=Micromonospora sp. NPDC049051 TaxID=3364264 RepID=UPI003723EEF0
MKLQWLTKAYAAGAGAAILALAGTVFAIGTTAQQPSVVDGASWLWSRNTGEATQVNAVSGIVALRQPMIDAQGHRVRISQSEQYVILHDLDTGRATSIDLARLGFSGSLELGLKEETALLLDKAMAVLVDRTRGIVRPVDPATLQAAGEPMRLPAPLVGGAFDKSGRLWLSVPSQGTAIALTLHAGQLKVERTEAVTAPGRPQALSVLDDGALVADRSGADTITVVGPQGARKITSPVPLASAIVPARTVGTTAVITVPAERKVVTIGDVTDGAKVGVLPLPSKGEATQPAVSFAGRVYVPDQSAGVVKVFEADGDPAGKIDVGAPQTSVELEVREDHLFINAPEADSAVMINSEGKSSRVQKYDPNPAATPTPDATPSLGTPPTVAPPSTRPVDPPQPTSPAEPPTDPAPTRTRVPVQPQRPGPPVPVTALAGDGEVRLSWGRATRGSAPVRSYTITWDEGGGGQVRVGGDVLRRTISGLTNGTTYRFRVVATNAVGAGPPALSQSVRPQATTPPATPAAPRAALEVGSAGNPTGAVEVDWAAVPQAADYVVTPILDGEAGAHPPQTVSGTSARFPGLTAGRTYTFTLTARNAAGRASAASPPSAPVRVHYAPGAPGGVSGQQSGPDTYLIRWTAARAHGVPVTSYVVRDSRGTVLARVNGSTLTATVTASGLTSVTVTAGSADGDGPPGSGRVQAATAPRVTITSTSATQNSITVRFTVDGGGSPRCTVSVGQQRVDSCTSPVTVRGLNADTAYPVTVEATNFAGTGRARADQRTKQVTYGAQVTCTDAPSNPQPDFCANGLPVYSASNDDGAVRRRVANGARIVVTCKVHGENQQAGPYNHDKEGDHWVRLTDGGWMSWVWLRFDNGDNVEAIQNC